MAETQDTLTKRDLDIPFGRLILLIFRLGFAAIPAALFFGILLFAVLVVIARPFGGLIGLENWIMTL